MKTVVLQPGERLKPAQLIRKGVLPEEVVASARDIVANVRVRGDEALREYSARFDGVELACLRLSPEVLEGALDAVDAPFRAALKKAARQIRDFHARELEQSWFTTRADGTLLGVKVSPVAAAGIYIPGGRA